MFLKDPGAVLDYRMDWAALLAPGVSVAGSSWLVEPAEAGGLETGAASMASTSTTIQLSGGIVGRSYRVVNRVALSDGASDERTMVVRVEER